MIIYIEREREGEKKRERINMRSESRKSQPHNSNKWLRLILINAT